MTVVPRLLEKVYDKIVGKGKELTGIKKSLFFWALELGLKFELDLRFKFAKRCLTFRLIRVWRSQLASKLERQSRKHRGKLNYLTSSKWTKPNNSEIHSICGKNFT